MCTPGCAVGALSCPCTTGGGCDAGLTCDAGTCVEGTSPPCDPLVNDDDCCGDGVVDAFEDCDQGWENNDTEECTTKCKHAVCGDGVVLESVEACDGGDECTPACTLKSCGNGVVDPGEWCEPRGGSDPECTHLCGDGRKIVFITSEHYKGGEIGGVAGGDAKCQVLAESAGLGGEFKAWLSTSPENAPIVRFDWLLGPYTDVNGVLIAETWKTLYRTPGVLAPNITELGTQTTDSELKWPSAIPTYLVAWASRQDGGDPTHCGEWADVTATGTASLLDHNPDIPNGWSKHFDVAWYGADCGLAAPIICVEQ